MRVWDSPDAEPAIPIEIVDLQRKHLRAVMAIEEVTASRAWGRSLWDQELANRDNRCYRVGLTDEVVGSFYGLLFLPDEAHITTIAVDPQLQRRGVGTQMMLDAVKTTIAKGIVNMSLEVRFSNAAARQLYTEFGFAPAGVRKNYYPETNEDGLVMSATDIDSEQFQERLTDLSARFQKPEGWNA